MNTAYCLYALRARRSSCGASLLNLYKPTKKMRSDGPQVALEARQ